MHHVSLSHLGCLSLVVTLGCGSGQEVSTAPVASAVPTATESAPVPALPTATAQEPAKPVETTAAVLPPPDCPAGMIKIKGGQFKLGPLKRDATVGDVCLEKTEVTAAAYGECVKAGKCTDFQLKCAEAATFGVAGKENHPIVCVDFNQSKAYCEYRGLRLPTEEEWEWAARGGEDGRKYAWGPDAPKDQACWSGSPAGARKGTCEVGAFASGTSKDGLVDMTGNVFEWTGSKADSAGSQFVGRGGSWRDGQANLLAVTRPGGFKPEYRCGFGGIRCAVDAKK